MNNMLTLEQMQKMNIDEMIDAYRQGYILSETSEQLQNSFQNQLQNPYVQYDPLQYNDLQYNDLQYNDLQYNDLQYNDLQYNDLQYNDLQYNDLQYQSIDRINKLSNHYDTSDIFIIAAAIGISVGLLGLLMQHFIRKEEERIVKEVKDAITSATQKVGLIERLMPTIQKIGERLLPPKSEVSTPK